eukprot:365652-Chlamydomonas_euryale.AAC.3
MASHPKMNGGIDTMGRWAHGQTDAWPDGRMARQTHGQVDAQADGRMARRTHGQTGKRTDGQKGSWADERKSM